MRCRGGNALASAPVAHVSVKPGNRHFESTSPAARANGRTFTAASQAWHNQLHFKYRLGHSLQAVFELAFATNLVCILATDTSQAQHPQC